MPFETVIYRRAELYEQVWTEPVRTVAQKYGISDVALAKVRKKLDVPLPGRGYWAKKSAGQKTRRTPLPKKRSGVAEELRRERWKDDGPSPPPPPESIARALEDEGAEDARIVVADELRAPHPLVREAKLLLRGQKAIKVVG